MSIIAFDATFVKYFQNSPSRECCHNSIESVAFCFCHINFVGCTANKSHKHFPSIHIFGFVVARLQDHCAFTFCPLTVGCVR